MQYCLNYSGTKFLPLKIKITQFSVDSVLIRGEPDYNVLLDYTGLSLTSLFFTRGDPDVFSH